MRKMPISGKDQETSSNLERKNSVKLEVSSLTQCADNQEDTVVAGEGIVSNVENCVYHQGEYFDMDNDRELNRFYMSLYPSSMLSFQMKKLSGDDATVFTSDHPNFVQCIKNDDDIPELVESSVDEDNKWLCNLIIDEKHGFIKIDRARSRIMQSTPKMCHRYPNPFKGITSRYHKKEKSSEQYGCGIFIDYGSLGSLLPESVTDCNDDKTALLAGGTKDPLGDKVKLTTNGNLHQHYPDAYDLISSNPCVAMETPSSPEKKHTPVSLLESIDLTQYAGEESFTHGMQDYIDQALRNPPTDQEIQEVENLLKKDELDPDTLKYAMMMLAEQLTKTESGTDHRIMTIEVPRDVKMSDHFKE